MAPHRQLFVVEVARTSNLQKMATNTVFNVKNKYFKVSYIGDSDNNNENIIR